MPRYVLAALGAVMLTQGALAETSICVDPQKSYVARALNKNEVFVQTSIGKAKPAIRVTTSCHHLESATAFGFGGSFGCLSRGDTVVANLIGERQNCVVTKVAAYAPQEGDFPDKK